MHVKTWVAIGIAMSALVVIPAPPAGASTGPPYDADDDAAYCQASDGVNCSASAHADAATGAIGVEARLTVPTLNTGSGFAQATGWVDGTFRPKTSTRTARVTAIVNVEAAEAAAFGSASDSASVELRLTVAAWCTCPGDWREVATSSVLVGTDGTTPRSVHNATRTLTAILSLSPGEKFIGVGDAVVRAIGRAKAASEIALERTLSTSADLHVSQLRVDLS